MIRSTWTLPIAIGAASLIGLAAALSGDGTRDAVSWAGLATPIVAFAWAYLKRR